MTLDEELRDVKLLNSAINAIPPEMFYAFEICRRSGYWNMGCCIIQSIDNVSELKDYMSQIYMKLLLNNNCDLSTGRYKKLTQNHMKAIAENYDLFMELYGANIPNLILKRKYTTQYEIE